MRVGWGTAALLAAGLTVTAAGAATRQAQSGPRNDYSAALQRLPPQERAARLAEVIGYWCVGTKTFLMGVAARGPEAGFAYWSLSCLNGDSYAVQIDPYGHAVAIACDVLAAEGQGRACFRKF